MPDQPIIIFCDNCDKGINLVAKETIYQCKECQGQVCNSCFNTEFKICVACAAPKIKARGDEAQRQREESAAQIRLKNSEPILRGLKISGLPSKKADFLHGKLMARFGNSNPAVELCLASDYYSSSRLFRGKEAKTLDSARFLILVGDSIYFGWGWPDRPEGDFECSGIAKNLDSGNSVVIYSVQAFDSKSPKSTAKVTLGMNIGSHFHPRYQTVTFEFSPSLSVSSKKYVNDQLQRIDFAWRRISSSK